MLADVHEDYKVTSTYALFTSIVCWVVQRIRATGAGPGDRAARLLLEELQQETATAAPWNLNPAQLVDFEFMPGYGLRAVSDLKASAVLIAIRNAVAHGDPRTVRPINAEGWLVGHEFKLAEYERPRGRLLWTGRVKLHRMNMKDMGDTLATRFCDRMRAANIDRPDFVEVANLVGEAEAA
jgi:hypothetical protein